LFSTVLINAIFIDDFICGIIEQGITPMAFDFFATAGKIQVADPRQQGITGILYKYLFCGLPGQIQQCLFQYP